MLKEREQHDLVLGIFREHFFDVRQNGLQLGRTVHAVHPPVGHDVSGVLTSGLVIGVIEGLSRRSHQFRVVAQHPKHREPRHDLALGLTASVTVVVRPQIEPLAMCGNGGLQLLQKVIGDTAIDRGASGIEWHWDRLMNYLRQLISDVFTSLADEHRLHQGV